MSEAMFRQEFDGATSVPVWTRPTHRGFAAVDRGRAGSFSAWVDRDQDVTDAPAQPNPGAESLIEQGYALGLAEGRRLAEVQLAEERAATAQLLASLEAFRPEPPAGLAAMLSGAVRRLVAQIVGEVEINANLLAERTQTVAALIADEAAPSRLRINPADAGRLGGISLPIDITPDPTVAPGAVLLETGSGWIEDGPAVRLEKLRIALDRMGAPK